MKALLIVLMVVFAGCQKDAPRREEISEMRRQIEELKASNKVLAEELAQVRNVSVGNGGWIRVTLDQDLKLSSLKDKIERNGEQSNLRHQILSQKIDDLDHRVERIEARLR